jgi:hypothetical protein
MLSRAGKLSWRAEHQIQPDSARTPQAGTAKRTPAQPELAARKKSATEAPSDTLGKTPQGHCSRCRQQTEFSVDTNINL